MAWTVLSASEIEDWAEGVDWYALVYPVILRAADGLNDHEARIASNTSLLGSHAHTGSDGTGKLTQANTHQSPDTDAATTSLHHTLGTGANQAAAGNDARFPVAQTGTFSRHATWTPAGVLDDQLFWDDLVTASVAVNLTGPPNPPAYNNTEMTIDFSATVTNTIQLVFQLPHAWSTGTTVHFHVHWKPNSTNAGNIVWEHKYRWTNINGVTGAWTTTTLTEAAPGVLDKHVIGAVKAISGTGLSLSSILQLQLQRLGNDGSDTFTGLAQVMSVDLHYQRDAPGTVNEYTKNA